MKIRIEVVPYDQAPWAPRVPGATWAYRVTAPSGNWIAGARIGSRKEIQQQADQCAATMAKCYTQRYRIGRNGYPTPAEEPGSTRSLITRESAVRRGRRAAA